MKEINIKADVTFHHKTVTINPEKVFRETRRQYLEFYNLPEDLECNSKGIIGSYEDNHRGGQDFEPYKGKLSLKQKKVIHAFHTLLTSL